MTSLEGRVLRRRQAVEPAGEARSELDVLADLAELLGSPVPLEREPAAVFDELARASAGGRADYSGLSHALLDDGRADALAGRPRLDAADVREHASPTADGLARMVAGRRRRAGRRPARGRAGLPRHRPGAGAVPVRGADPPRPGAEPHGARVVRGAAPAAGAAPRHRVGRRRPGDLDPRHGHGTGAHHARRSARTRCSCRSTGPASARQRGHQRRDRPGLGDAGVQGVRGLRGPRRRRSWMEQVG